MVSGSRSYAAGPARVGKPASRHTADWFVLTGHSVAGGSYPERMNLEFSGEIWFWKGPAPFHFVTVPDEESAAIEDVSGLVSYGWGVIPVAAAIGHTDWTTSLFPKDGGYVLPVKVAVRRAEGLELGDVVDVRLALDT